MLPAFDLFQQDHFFFPRKASPFIISEAVLKQFKDPFKFLKHLNNYANAEVNDGTEIARTMQYFKESDPMDQSHGALSKRVHYLKCEEGGYQEMCEVAEKIYKEGVAEGRMAGHTEGLAEGQTVGELNARQETARTLKEMGMSEEDIAKAVNTDLAQVREWLSGKTDLTK